MSIYYDTAVLLKLYTVEPESAAVRAFVTQAAALHLGIRQFATSDQRQNSLTSRVGLRVLDPTKAA